MKRRNFLRNVGIGAAVAALPISAIAQIQKKPNSKFHNFVTSFDADEVLKGNPHYAILDRYARKTGFEKRHKLWFTGSASLIDGKHIDELHLNILFESNFRGFDYNPETGGQIPIQGIIIKDKFLIESDVNLKEQVNAAYDRFFHQVMRNHFGPGNDPTFEPFQKGMMNSRPAKKLS